MTVARSRRVRGSCRMNIQCSLREWSGPGERRRGSCLRTVRRGAVNACGGSSGSLKSRGLGCRVSPCWNRAATSSRRVSSVTKRGAVMRAAVALPGSPASRRE
eukprot:12930619-Prorocentrum_lima.AAC.1